MTHKSFVLALGIFLVGLTFAESASACRCREPGASAAYKMADLVVLVLARVVAVEPGTAPSEVKMQLAVQEAWKAASADRIVVTTRDPCAYPVAVDAVHLLFIKSATTGELTTARCFGNGPVAARPGAWDPLESTCRHASLSIL